MNESAHKRHASDSEVRDTEPPNIEDLKVQYFDAYFYLIDQ